MLQIYFIVCQNFNQKSRNSEGIDNLSETFKMTLNYISKFPKVWKIWKSKKLPPNHALVFLHSNSWQCQKQLMTKSETRLGFKPLGNQYYIKREISSNK